MLIRVRSRQHRDTRFGVAGVGGKMRDTGGDVDHVAWNAAHEFGQSFAEPHLSLPADDIDRGFVVFVQMRFGASPRWNRQQVHAERARADTLR